MIKIKKGLTPIPYKIIPHQAQHRISFFPPHLFLVPKEGITLNLNFILKFYLLNAQISIYL